MNWEQLLSSNRLGGQNTGAKPDRSEFEKDFDRIIFSLPFRRLQDKTQVFPLPEDDFVHNRLTHSLEVASVGRSLGKLTGERLLAKDKNLGEQVKASDFGAIVSAASLAHDVGNPPFGHSGENAISDFFKFNSIIKDLKPHLADGEWADSTNFEGNAQGFRLINQSLHGLKLTCATLGAFTKYPRQSLIQKKQTERASQKKYGFQLGLVQQGGQSVWRRHPLAFLVEAADDICYHIIDLEDGCTLGLVSLDESVELLKPIIGKKFDKKKFNQKQSQHEKLGTLRAMAINELIGQTVEVFVDSEGDILSGSFDKPLTSLINSAQAMSNIQSVSVERIYRARVVLEKEVAGFEVIDGLLSALVKAVFGFTIGKSSNRDQTLIRSLPNEVTLNLVPDNLYHNLRVILDYVSGMTDSHALTMYRKLKGMSLPSW